MSFLNYPKTEYDEKWWGSRSKVNKVLAIIAYSYDEENAIANLRRHGNYAYLFRRYHAWNNLGCYVNARASGSMANVPFHDVVTPWFDVMPYKEQFDGICWNTGPVTPITLAITNQPVNGQVGTPLTISFAGNQYPIKVEVLRGTTVVTTTNINVNNYSYTPTTTGSYSIRLTDATNKTVTSNTVTVVAAPVALAWGSSKPTSGTVGDKLTYTWTGGTAPFDFVVIQNGVEVDRVNVGNALTYQWDTTTRVAGTFTVSVQEQADHTKEIHTDVVLSAAVSYVLKLFDAGTQVELTKNTSGVYQLAGTTTTANDTLTVQVWKVGGTTPESGGGNNFTVSGGDATIAAITGTGATSHTATIDFGNPGDTTWTFHSDAKYNTSSDLQVSVSSGVIPVKGVTITETSINAVEHGTGGVLHWTIDPTNATNKGISFQSSNTNVITINRTSGRYVINNAGTATITITTDDGGFTDSIPVTVTAAVVDAVNSVSVIPATVASVDVGSTQQFTATVDATGNAAKTVTWSVNNGGTISATGLFTAKLADVGKTFTVTATSTFDATKHGTATITAVADSNAITWDSADADWPDTSTNFGNTFKASWNGGVPPFDYYVEELDTKKRYDAEPAETNRSHQFDTWSAGGDDSGTTKHPYPGRYKAYITDSEGRKFESPTIHLVRIETAADYAAVDGANIGIPAYGLPQGATVTKVYTIGSGATGVTLDPATGKVTLAASVTDGTSVTLGLEVTDPQGKKSSDSSGSATVHRFTVDTNSVPDIKVGTTGTITINPNTVKYLGYSLNGQDLTLANDITVKWKSSDTTIATVNETTGVITPAATAAGKDVYIYGEFDFHGAKFAGKATGGDGASHVNFVA